LVLLRSSLVFKSVTDRSIRKDLERSSYLSAWASLNSDQSVPKLPVVRSWVSVLHSDLSRANCTDSNVQSYIGDNRQKPAGIGAAYFVVIASLASPMEVPLLRVIPQANRTKGDNCF